MIRNFLLAGLIFALYFIWPIPHTIGVRYLLLATSLLVFGVFALSSKNRFYFGPRAKTLLGIYVTLSAWIVANAAWISPEPAWAFGEIEGQWLNAGFALLAGILTAITFLKIPRLNPAWLIAVLVVALCVHEFYIDWSSIHGWLTNGGPLPRRLDGLTNGPDKSDYLTTAFLAFLMAESYTRWIRKARFLLFPNWMIALFFAASLFAFYVEEIRNGLVPVAAMLVALASLYLVEHREKMNPRRVLLNSLVFVIIAMAFGLFMVKTDARWNNVLTSAEVAWNTKDNSAWLNNRPNEQIQVLPNGQPVEDSAYLRTVMLKEGLLIVKDHPLGVGYGRNAFGHALKAKYGEGSGHSHSGLLDIAISIGIPGLLLWLVLLIYTLRLSWNASIRDHTFQATALLLIVLNFGIRGIFDSVIRDHMLEQFMFTAGALLIMTLLPHETASEST